VLGRIEKLPPKAKDPTLVGYQILNLRKKREIKKEDTEDGEEIEVERERTVK